MSYCPGNGECLVQCPGCTCSECSCGSGRQYGRCNCGITYRCADCQGPYTGDFCRNCGNCGWVPHRPRPIPQNQCTCGHKGHTEYCPSLCPHDCKPLLCPNDPQHDEKDRGHLYPKQYLESYGGNCLGCSMACGMNFKRLEQPGECHICSENDKELMELRCGHGICSICWKKWTTDKGIDSICPMCRGHFWGGYKTH
jgi:hypothetical protein